ncbi:N-acetylmuramoyl-L-alanine amidase [Clostridium beijerinckii]|uniref:N-acetylmuramoyl-L-alanine amidase n=1 Tax=Clostridium beijerinckii TaxID=1520 RepID=UPI0014946688|nr:N-acetylmuramoyl-L-alanine amidase [Clostridium beijerinckii]NOW03246.1 N-acetylmuramoyl-L-alanine amidase [Clostridium beijerinckii]NYC03612.1 N-acetylmuramoyl-L-alanine amidase [Clostridium beijerinckii]
MKIAIDFGHGVGSDRGAVGVIAEETIINSVGTLVVSKLNALGHTVIEVRPTSALSVSDSLSQRCQKADNNNVDLFVSLHANAGGGVGTEVFTYNAKEVPEARAVLNNIVSLGFTNRGIKDGSGLYVVKHPSATAMLIEICFCDTQSDVDKYNSIGAEAIANAIVSGLTGQTVSTESGKGYVVTSYLPNAYEGYDGIDINYVLSYFGDVKCYVRGNDKGIWIETSYLTIDKCNELKSTLGSWFYEIKY